MSKFSGKLPAYDPYNLNRELRKGTVSMKDVRKEYSRLRKIITKRVARMEKAGFAGTSFVRRNKSIPVLKGLTDAQVRYGLADLYMAVNRKDSTIKGMRQVYKERREWLSLKFGLEIDNAEELAQFGRMMNYVKAACQDRLLDSDQIAIAISKEGVQELWKDFMESDSDAVSDKFKNRITKLLTQSVADKT